MWFRPWQETENSWKHIWKAIFWSIPQFFHIWKLRLLHYRLDKTCQYQELLATSSPQRLEHVYKPNVWGTSDEMETMWSENDGKLIALIVSMVSNTQERKIPSSISRREQHRTQYWLDINIFSVSEVRKAQKYCIDSQHIELFLLIDIFLFLW